MSQGVGRAVSPELFASISFDELHTLYPWGNILVSYDLVSKGYTKLYASLPSLAPPSAQEGGIYFGTKCRTYKGKATASRDLRRALKVPSEYVLAQGRKKGLQQLLLIGYHLLCSRAHTHWLLGLNFRAPDALSKDV